MLLLELVFGFTFSIHIAEIRKFVNQDVKTYIKFAIRLNVTKKM